MYFCFALDLKTILLKILGGKSINPMSYKKNYEEIEGFEEDELEILSRQVTPDELFILSFLKGFNRKVTREWEKKGLWDFSVEYSA